MPTLMEYASGSEKDGYYILANAGGDSPVTLQTVLIAERIFTLLGYSDGDSIPADLVWSMYSIDMLYTLSSINLENTVSDVRPGEVLDELGIESKLSEDEKSKLISYLSAYTGPDAELIEDLRDELLDDLSDEEISPSFSSKSSFLNYLPSSREEVKRKLDEWTSGEVSEIAQAALELHEGFVRWSVRTFSGHPNLVNSPICEIDNKEIKYEVEPLGIADRIFVSDARGHDKMIKNSAGIPRDYDYVVKRILFDGTTEKAYVKQKTIIDYQSDGSRGGEATLGYKLGDILPPNKSYFGGTESKDYQLQYLERDILENPAERAGPDFGMVTTNFELESYINNHSKVALLEIEGESNSGNAKSSFRGYKLVITDVNNPVKGEKVIVPIPDKISNDKTINTSVQFKLLKDRQISYEQIEQILPY